MSSLMTCKRTERTHQVRLSLILECTDSYPKNQLYSEQYNRLEHVAI